MLNTPLISLFLFFFFDLFTQKSVILINFNIKNFIHYYREESKLPSLGGGQRLPKIGGGGGNS